MKIYTCTRLVAVVAALLLALPAFAAPTLTYQGALNGENGAVNASLPMSFALYPAANGGNAIWTESHDGVSVVDGSFTCLLYTSPSPRD